MKESVIEYAGILEGNTDGSSKNGPRGTITAHFVKFMNELLEVMDVDEDLKSIYFRNE